MPIIVNGVEIGMLEFSYFSKPFPFYYLNNLRIQNAYRGEGYGRAAMEFFNAYLKRTGKAGLLYDSMRTWVKAKGMYQRYGWQRVPGSRFLAYNIPNGASLEQLKHFDERTYSESRLRRVRRRSEHPDRIQ